MNRANFGAAGGYGWHAALLTSALLLFGASAFASPKPSPSQKLMEEGIELRRAGRDAEAVTKLQEAYGLEATPRAAAQLGLCLQALGRWTEADAKISEAISATKDPWINKNRKTLKDSIEIVKTHVGRIEIVGTPEGAAVNVNGRNVGQLPLKEAIPVNEGNVDVEVLADGFEVGQRTLTVTGGGYQNVVIKLARLERPLPSISTPSASEGQGTNDSPMASTADVAAPPSEQRSVLKSPWLWAGLGLIAVGVATALVLSTGDPKSPGFDDSGAL